ncbi:MAG: hypothetical protein ACTSU5_15270 [Promethearchaeota archaeon]
MAISMASSVSAAAMWHPDQYADLDYQNRQLDYEITASTGVVEWAQFNWLAPSRGIVTLKESWRISVNFTGFYKPDANDWSKSSYYAPDGNLSIPYIGISVPKLENGKFVQNFTLSNVSNTEAAFVLNLGYSGCNTGFLSSTNWTHVKSIGEEVSSDTSFTPANFTYTDKDGKITLDFAQKSGAKQNTTLVYEKSTGILLEAVTEIKINTLYSLSVKLIQGTDIPGYAGVFFVAGLAVFGTVAVSLRRAKFKKH